MSGWWTIRRIVFLVLAWLALGMAAFNASAVPEDRRIPHFFGGAIWAILFLAVALWPRRKPPAEQGRTNSPKAWARPWERGASGSGPRPED